MLMVLADFYERYLYILRKMRGELLRESWVRGEGWWVDQSS
jgi:hypothetical protein